MKVIDVSHNNTKVQLADGEAFEVRLPENAGTGYQWTVADHSDAVELLDDAVIAPSTTVLGAEGLHRFRFVTRRSGSHRLVLELRRSWEQRSEPEKRFEVSISTARGPASQR